MSNGELLSSIPDKTNIKKSRFSTKQKIGAVVAGSALVIGGGLLLKNNSRQTINGSTEISDSQANKPVLTPAEQMELQQKSDTILANVTGKANMNPYADPNGISDQAAWESAFSLATSDPQQAAQILAESGASQQLFQLASVVDGDEVWTTDFVRINKKMADYFDYNDYYSTNGQDLLEFMQESGVYNYLPNSSIESDSYSESSMFSGVGILGPGAMQSKGGLQGTKEYIKYSLSEQTKPISLFVDEGIITSTEGEIALQSFETAIQAVDDNFDTIMNS